MQGKAFADKGTLRERRNKPCADCPGYYYFEALQPENSEPGILCIVLDTTTRNFRFAQGTVYRHRELDRTSEKQKDLEQGRLEQINWLKNILKNYSQEGNWMVLVFGHHQLGEGFFDDSYKKLLELFHEPKNNVIAYFCGHTHTHKIKYYKNPINPGIFGFWEIITGSIMEFPKKGSLVTLKYTKEGVGEILVQSFGPYFLEELDGKAPKLLKNAKKCLNSSKEDNNGKKLKEYNKLDLKHHDVVLKFMYSKAK